MGGGRYRKESKMNTTTVTNLIPAEVRALNDLAYDLGLNRSIVPEYLARHMAPDLTCPAAVVVPLHDRGRVGDIAHHRLIIRLNDGDEVLIDVPAEVWEWVETHGCSPVTPLVKTYAAMFRVEVAGQDDAEAVGW